LDHASRENSTEMECVSEGASEGSSFAIVISTYMSTPIMTLLVQNRHGNTGSTRPLVFRVMYLSYNRNAIRSGTATSMGVKTSAERHGMKLLACSNPVMSSVNVASMSPAPMPSTGPRSKHFSRCWPWCGKWEGMQTSRTMAATAPAGTLGTVSGSPIDMLSQIYSSRNTHRQVACSLIAPPQSGPTQRDTTNAKVT
jgi:hypothetical protein